MCSWINRFVVRYCPFTNDWLNSRLLFLSAHELISRRQVWPQTTQSHPSSVLGNQQRKRMPMFSFSVLYKMLTSGLAWMQLFVVIPFLGNGRLGSHRSSIIHKHRHYNGSGGNIHQSICAYKNLYERYLAFQWNHRLSQQMIPIHWRTRKTEEQQSPFDGIRQPTVKPPVLECYFLSLPPCMHCDWLIWVRGRSHTKWSSNWSSQ